MNGDQIFNLINNIHISIKNHKEEIEKLDQEIGDGDHIFNILRGLDEILNLKEELMDKSINDIFKQLGMKIMTTVGGSSGALFATLLIGMSKKYNSDLIIYDRGPIDVLAYLNFKSIEIPKELISESKKINYIYAFILNPWKDIYSQDEVRYESFEECISIHNFLINE